MTETNNENNREELLFMAWLKDRDPDMYSEISTSTADVAVFQQPVLPVVRRGEKKRECPCANLKK